MPVNNSSTCESRSIMRWRGSVEDDESSTMQACCGVWGVCSSTCNLTCDGPPLPPREVVLHAGANHEVALHRVDHPREHTPLGVACLSGVGSGERMRDAGGGHGGRMLVDQAGAER